MIDYGFKITRMDELNVNCSRDRFVNFVKNLKESAVIRKFCDGKDVVCAACEEDLVPDFVFQQKNILLQNLFEPALEGEPLQKIASEIPRIVRTITISHEEISAVEKLTRKQADPDLWKKVRIGRITASIMKECIRASLDVVPSKMSLLKKICFPDAVMFTNEATTYGRRHEKDAKKALIKELACHGAVEFHECGVYICKDQPYLAATPDLIMTCNCHGKISIEIKCPYRLRENNTFNQQLPMGSLIGTSDPFLEMKNGEYCVVEKHAYYAQIQAQIFITDSNYGMLYVWSKKDKLCLLVEKNPTFWEEACERSKQYFEKNVLVELVSNHFSNKLSNNTL